MRVGIIRGVGRWVLEVFAQRLLQLHPIQQQVIALPGLFIPQRLGNEHQAPAGPGPVQHLIDLPGRHVVAVAEHQQAVMLWCQGWQDVEAVGMVDTQALLAQKKLGGQVGVGQGFRRRAVVDFGRVGRCLEVQPSHQRAEQHSAHHTDDRPGAPVQRTIPGPNTLRQASHSSRCACAGGSRCP
ncbi:hypothetical protein D3C76_1310830 [compost metagenome]